VEAPYQFARAGVEGARIAARSAARALLGIGPDDDQIAIDGRRRSDRVK